MWKHLMIEFWKWGNYPKNEKSTLEYDERYLYRETNDFHLFEYLKC